MSAVVATRSIRLRLTLWYATAMAVGLVVFAAVSYLLIRNEVLERTDHLLDESAHAVGAELQLEYRMLGSRERAVDETLRGVRFRGVTLGVLDTNEPGGIAFHRDSTPAVDAVEALSDSIDGATRAALLRSVEMLRAPARSDADFVLVDDADGPGVRVRLLAAPLGVDTAVVVAARDRRDDALGLRHAALVFAGLVVLALMVAVAGGYALARRTLSPITAISRQAQAMGARDLSARLPVANPDDELGGLARVINDLLQRIEGSVAQQRQFVADASHELRTPVAIIRNEASVTLALPARPEREYRDALGAVTRESERLTALVEDLFLLARADAGGQPLRPEPLYLDDLLRDVARATRTLAERRQVQISVAADAVVDSGVDAADAADAADADGATLGD
ncbi:MAG: histidine kinase dimerization/phospho-acceptor domain-containing protein, partial [Gemmatimonadota bacterium]